MMNIIVGLIFVVLGVCCALWPRAFWGLFWRRLWVREPTRTELLVTRVCGVVRAIAGLAIAQLYIF